MFSIQKYIAGGRRGISPTYGFLTVKMLYIIDNITRNISQLTTVTSKQKRAVTRPISHSTNDRAANSLEQIT